MSAGDVEARFVGHLGRAEVREAMGKARALVLPSRAENYPLVLLEAMATGLPVITTRVGGIPEMITSGESGLLVGAEDRDALVEALLRVEQEPALCESLATAGLAVARRHRWEKVGEEIEILLTEAVDAA